MGEAHLITGHAAAAHVTAADAGLINAASFGSGSYVLNVGEKFAASMQGSNTVRILDGVLIMQGRQVLVDIDSYVDLTIDNGTTDKYRNDLVVMRYSRDTTTGIESAELTVIKGTEAVTSPQDPSFVSGDIIGGDASADFPLWRVPLSGLAVGTPVALFDVMTAGGRLSYKNVSVPTTAWEADSTYTKYPKKAVITCRGVSASMFADVILGAVDSVGGNYAPVCLTGTDSVTIYAKTTPATVLTIPLIVAQEV